MIDRNVTALLQHIRLHILRDSVAAVCPGQKGLITCSACDLVPGDQALTVIGFLPFDKSALPGFFGYDQEGNGLRALEIVGCLRCGHCDHDCPCLDTGHGSCSSREGHCRNRRVGRRKSIVCRLPGTPCCDLDRPLCGHRRCGGFQCQCLLDPGDRKGLSDSSRQSSGHAPDHDGCGPRVDVIGIGQCVVRPLCQFFICISIGNRHGRSLRRAGIGHLSPGKRDLCVFDIPAGILAPRGIEEGIYIIIVDRILIRNDY